MTKPSIKIMHKKINFLYEFKGPNGYVPIGFDYKQIGILFDVLNQKEWDGSIYSNRCGYDGIFKILDESASAYDFLNIEADFTGWYSTLPHEFITSINDDYDENQFLFKNKNLNLDYRTDILGIKSLKKYKKSTGIYLYLQTYVRTDI